MVSDMMPDTLKKLLIKQHYKLVGKHSAVKTCHWLRKSLRDEGVCYKQTFYPDNVKSHTCLQMTPSISCCNLCRYCWRAYPKSVAPGWNEMAFKGWDEPKEIIAGAIEAQRQLLTGFKGWDGVNKKKWREAQKPGSAALSLTGESTLYPGLSGLIEGFHGKGMKTFLVTNGQFPERLEKITEPSQLYISLDAPDKKIYKELDRPRIPDFWERLNKSLELMNSLSCRRVIRLTMVKGWNMTKAKEYARLIEKANPDFLEIKGYVHVGASQKRLPRDSMPFHNVVKEFAKDVERESGYRHKGEQKESRVVLLEK